MRAACAWSREWQGELFCPHPHHIPTVFPHPHPIHTIIPLYPFRTRHVVLIPILGDRTVWRITNTVFAKCIQVFSWHHNFCNLTNDIMTYNRTNNTLLLHSRYHVTTVLLTSVISVPRYCRIVYYYRRIFPILAVISTVTAVLPNSLSPCEQWCSTNMVRYVCRISRKNLTVTSTLMVGLTGREFWPSTAKDSRSSTALKSRF